MRLTNNNDMLYALSLSIKKYVDRSLSNSVGVRKDPLDPDVTNPQPKPVKEPLHDPAKPPIEDTRIFHMDC